MNIQLFGAQSRGIKKEAKTGFCLFFVIQKQIHKLEV
jgi:hypothetical protein